MYFLSAGGVADVRRRAARAATRHARATKKRDAAQHMHTRRELRLVLFQWLLLWPSLCDGEVAIAVEYASAMHSFVSTWIKAEESRKKEDKPSTLPPWPEWAAPIGPLRSLLLQPNTLARHPWSGCRLSTICYPSLAFLQDTLRQYTRSTNDLAPGALIVELNSFMGEASVGLAEALDYLKLKATIIAVDTWHEHQGYMGSFQLPHTFVPPQVASDAARFHPEWMSPGRSILFEQYVRNVNESGAVAKGMPPMRDHIRPIPLFAPDMVSRAAELGATGSRPFLIYIGAPRRPERMRHDLQQAWRLLACGGTLFGSGYHLNRREIDEFVPKIGDDQPALEARVVHAPGATKFENISVPFSEELMAAFAKSNFSTWAIRGKRCSQQQPLYQPEHVVSPAAGVAPIPAHPHGHPEEGRGPERPLAPSSSKEHPETRPSASPAPHPRELESMIAWMEV